MKAKNTEVKIEAHGHLGAFSRTYLIAVGEEERMFRLIARDFASYVLRPLRRRYREALRVLEELKKSEEGEAQK